MIENYFAKLNSSYYQQEEISRTYESIGQFGIGVFSYFLLCDYFDVETKNHTNDAIKFRVTKDSDSSFYFFDNPIRKEPGTTITMYLNTIIDFSELIQHIEFYFSYIDIPLKLSDTEGNIYIISKKSYEEDKTKLLSENVNLLEIERLNELDIIGHEINKDYFEGKAHLFVFRKEGQIYPESLFKIIDKYSRSNYNIYLKGIFVGVYRSVLLNYTVGNINIKNKLILNLSRSQFKNNIEVIEILTTFEKAIINQVFQSWISLPLDYQFKLTNEFIKEYINIAISDDEFISILRQYWILKILDDYTESYIKLDDLLKKDSFIILNHYCPINLLDSQLASICI